MHLEPLKLTWRPFAPEFKNFPPGFKTFRQMVLLKNVCTKANIDLGDLSNKLQSCDPMNPPELQLNILPCMFIEILGPYSTSERNHISIYKLFDTKI